MSRGLTQQCFSRFETACVPCFDHGSVSVGLESFSDWGGRGYDDSVPEVVIKTAPSGDRTAWPSI